MAEYKKSRTPYYFKDDDYDNFLYGIEKYHDDHGTDPDFYPHWATLEPLIAAFHTAYQGFVAARQLIENTKEVFDDKVKVLRESMVGLRRQLPVLLRDESVLGHFGLEEDVPTDADLLLVNARICRDYWDSLCVPDPPAEYLPLAEKLDANTVLLTETEDAQRDYADAIRNREEARVVKDEAREAVNEEEREMFKWYRGIWTDPEDDRWSATPWGASRGGSGGGEEPGGELPEIPDAPEGVYATFSETPVIHILVGCDEYGEHSGFDIRKAVTPAGLTETPPMPESNLATNIDAVNEPLMDTDIEPGNRYWYWIRARNGEEVGEWSEVVWAEYK